MDQLKSLQAQNYLFSCKLV